MMALRVAASVTPLNGFMLLFGTTLSGFAMNRSRVGSSHVSAAIFMAAEELP
jgi:hypothetical protein